MIYRFVLRAALTLFIAALFSFSVHASEKVWTSPTSGTFNDPANWTGGVPGVEDTALFNTSGAYDVVFDSVLFPLDAVVENQGVTFASGSLLLKSGVGGPYTYHLTGAGENDINISTSIVNLGIAGGPLHLTADDDLTIHGNATLNVNFGSEVNVDQLHLGASNGSGSGTIIVDGTGGTSRLNAASDTIIGANDGSGFLTYRDNARGDLSTAATVRIGAEDSGLNGQLTVSTDASIRIGNVMVGTGIPASGGGIQVSSGGKVEHVGSSYLAVGNGIATTSSLTGAVTISGGTYTVGTGKTTVQGRGEISVSGGQFLTSGDVEVAAPGGTFPGSFDAEFRLLSGSVFTQSGDTDITIGSSSGGPSMFIASGTSVTTGTGLLTINKTGTLDLNNGTFTARGDVLVDGGLIDHSSNVTFTVAPGRVMTLQNGGRFNTTGIYSVSPNTTVNIIGGASKLNSGDGINVSNGALVQLSSSGTMGSLGGLTVGSQTSGTLRATGVGSGFTVGSSLWGTGSAVAQVSLSDGAVGTVNGVLRVGFNTLSAGGSVVDIDSGARLIANDLQLKVDGGPDPSTFATLTIRGAGSALSIKDNGDLLLGSTFGSPTGSATVNVLDGGALTLGANGGTQLNRSATINIDGGIVDLKTLNQNGGKINFTSGSLTYSGSLNIANGELLGANMTLGASKRLTVDGTSTIYVNSLVRIDDQGQFTTGLLNNNGELRLDGVSALITATTVLNNGMIRGSGRINAEVQNSAVGEIRVGANQQLQMNGLLGNGGDIVAIGAVGAPAELNVSGPATNAASTGLIVGREAILDFKSGLVNAGALALNQGTNDVFGDVNNTGSVVVTGGSHTTFYDDVVQNGTMTVSKVGSTTSVAVFLGDFSGDGGASGGGDIFFEGDLQPGNSPAAVTYSNNVYFGAGTVLGIEIGGLAPGAGHDKVTVNGALNLDGTLQVSLVDGFTPSVGDSYEILDWSTLSGSFDQLVLPSLGSLAWDTSQLYTNGVLAIAQGAAIPGDSNLDNVVDAADYVAWRKINSLNSGGYSDFYSNFGTTSGTGGIGQGAVPEPAGIIYAIVAVVSAIVLRRR